MAARDWPGFEVDDATVIWRYMAVDRFRDLLAGHLYFAAAHQFEDQFEGAITDAEMSRRRLMAAEFDDPDPWLETESWAFEDLRRMTKINRWHAANHENVAMWERYIRPGVDGVALRSTAGALKRSLREFRLQPQYGEETIVVGGVRYLDFATEGRVDRSMLSIFLYKRIEYRDEHEIRALLSLRMATEFGVPIPGDGVTVGTDVDALINEVRLSPGVRDATMQELAEATKAAAARAPLVRSTLSRPPTY